MMTWLLAGMARFFWSLMVSFASWHAILPPKVILQGIERRLGQKVCKLETTVSRANVSTTIASERLG